MMFYKNKCTGCGKCLQKCPHAMQTCDLCGACTLYCPNDAREICGKAYTVDEVLCEIVKDKMFYETSGGGVTFSGGECMLQIDFLAQILKRCREHGIRTAVDTAGHLPWSYFERIIPDTDLFLFDVKCMDPEAHLRYTGVKNELILDNLSRLLAQKAPVWIRVPVIAGVNDTEEEAKAIRDFLLSHGTPQKVELLPYHAMGEHKYDAIGQRAQGFGVPKEETMKKLKEILT